MNYTPEEKAAIRIGLRILSRRVYHDGIPAINAEWDELEGLECPTPAQLEALGERVMATPPAPVLILAHTNDAVTLYGPAALGLDATLLAASDPDASSTDAAEAKLLKEGCHPSYPGYEEIAHIDYP